MAIFTAVGAINAGKDARRARLAAKTTQGELNALEKNRQTIINPYEGVKDLSSMVSDLSGIASNPYANLGVAPQAAEIEIEQADISLANALDTIRATGSGAGGATALAQAALQSKKGVAASIEKQEANNEQLRAQGEANLQSIKMAEAQRVQQTLMGEQGRLQEAAVAGSEFMYREKENRQMQELNRKSSILSGQQQQEMAAKQNQAAALAGGAQAVGQVASSLIPGS